MACEMGKSEVVRFLLTSKIIKKKADIHAGHDYGFIWACENNHMELVNELIFEHKIKKTKDIRDYILGSHIYKELNKMFDARDLNEKLKKNLQKNDKVEERSGKI